MKIIKAVFFISCFVFFLPGCLLYAASGESYAEVRLKNGDKVSGRVVSEDGEVIKLENDFMGAVSVRKEGVSGIVYDKKEKSPPEEKPEKRGPWSGEFSIGYDKSGGNTRESNLDLRLCLNRKTEGNEFTVKGEMLYSSSNNKMDAQKWYNMIRYAYSFSDRRWYNFYKVENDHDRFANISYRLVPSLGFGYWFVDSPGLKFVCELGAGLEHSEFRANAKDKDEAVLLPRAFFEKAVFGMSRITQEFSMYPSLSYPEEYRLHSETAFINPINEKLSLRLSFVDDYNSHPSEEAKKNDYRFISSLSYSF